jgi:hypothetical protein
MGAIVSSFFFDFAATKRIRIRDPMLGLANRVIQLACILYQINDFIAGGFLLFGTPRGSAQFWANQANLRVAQAEPNPAYCTASQINYGDRFCQQERDSGFGIFCEFDVQCKAFSFSEMNIKGENQMFFMTINKDVEINYGRAGDAFQQQCSDFDVDNDIELETGLVAGESAMDRYNSANRPVDLESNYIYYASETGQATCTKMVNEYAMGVEGMTMAFGHSYALDRAEKFDERVREGHKVVTYLHRAGDVIDPAQPDKHVERSCYIDGKKTSPCMFDSGSGVELSIEEWLTLGGLKDGLDDVNKVGMKGRPPFSDAELTYRTSGVAIELDLQWMGGWSKGQSVELHIFVDAKGGWHSKGSEVHYADYPESASDGIFTSGRLYDRYKRGINFRFRYGGVIDTFDYSALIVKITSLTVLLAISEVLVAAIAVTLLGYKSKVYEKVLEEPLSISSIHAKIATQALIATAAYTSINGHDKKGGALSREDIVLAFTNLNMPHNEAEKIAAHIMASALLDENGSLPFNAFADMFGTDETTLQEVIAHIGDPIDSSNVTIAEDGAPGLPAQKSMKQFRVGASRGPQDYDIQVPAGAKAGGLISFSTHDGRTIQVRIPQNAAPGSTLRIKA